MTKISFEFFPPKTMKEAFRLSRAVAHLAPFSPAFASVTYGAGGQTRQFTHDAVTAIGGTYGVNVAAHMTCVGASRAETMAVAQAYADAGVREIVALRGDPPAGQRAFAPHPDGFANACELTAALAATGRFTIRTTAYPDGHPEKQSTGDDLDWLRAKLDAGASSAITQFFFEADSFLRFRDRAAAAGISAPILPGILPVTNWANIQRFAARCGMGVPANVAAGWARAVRDNRARLYAVAQCATMCEALRREGVEHLHFFTLNQPELTRDVLLALGHEADQPQAAVA